MAEMNSEVRRVQQYLVKCVHICKCFGLFLFWLYFFLFILMYLLVHNLTQLSFLRELIFLSNNFLISYNINKVFTVVTAYKTAVSLQNNLRLNEICISVLWNGKEKEGTNAQYGTNKPAQKITWWHIAVRSEAMLHFTTVLINRDVPLKSAVLHVAGPEGGDHLHVCAEMPWLAMSLLEIRRVRT